MPQLAKFLVSLGMEREFAKYIRVETGELRFCSISKSEFILIGCVLSIDQATEEACRGQELLCHTGLTGYVLGFLTILRLSAKRPLFLLLMCSLSSSLGPSGCPSLRIVEYSTKRKDFFFKFPSFIHDSLNVCGNHTQVSSTGITPMIWPFSWHRLQGYGHVCPCTQQHMLC